MWIGHSDFGGVFGAGTVWYVWPAGDGSHKSRWPNIWHVHAPPQFIHWECVGAGAVSEIFDNKNCHTAPPAHLLTRTPHTSCAKNLDHCLELQGKQRQWNWDDDGTKDTGTFPLLHNLVQNCVLEYSGKCRVCVLYLVTGVGYPGLLKSLGLIYDFRHRMPHSSTNRVAKRSFQGHDGAFFSEVTSRDIQFTLSVKNCFFRLMVESKL